MVLPWQSYGAAVRTVAVKRADRAGRVRPFVVDSKVAFPGAYGEFWALIRKSEHQTRKSIEIAREKEFKNTNGAGLARILHSPIASKTGLWRLFPQWWSCC